MSDLAEVFSSGGGTQSSAIAALIILGELPRPDFVVIADTGREMPSTWAYLDEHVAPALAAIGLPVNRVKASEYGNAWGQDIFATNGDLLIPAYSSIGNSKLSNFCTKAWKIEVVNRWLSKEHGITRRMYRKWIGFSLDEKRRILSMMAGKEYKTGLIRFPLVHDYPMNRDRAKAIISRVGWPEPPRSRCWCCPNQSDKEWAEVMADDALAAQAVAMDEAIRERDKDAFLHSSIRPLAGADLSAQDDLFSRSCPTGECFV
jgi:3'-phosphoadenosine 5'-phosphosulfate sulfotransferase (PAPS reductase)/FAD synthetase